MWRPPTNPVDAYLKSEAEPWLHHITTYLQGVGIDGWEGHGLRFDGPDLKYIHVLTPKGTTLTSALTLVHYRDLLYVLVSGKQEDAPLKQIVHWLAAIDYAGKKLSEKHPSFGW